MLGLDHPAIWIIGVIARAGASAPRIGAFNGFLVAYLGIPSFIVTLGGLIVLARRGLVGDPRRDGRAAGRPFRADRRRPPGGSIGATASWVFGALVCVGHRRRPRTAGRRRRARFNFPQRPIWAEVSIVGVGCVVALGATWRSSTPIPGRRRSPQTTPTSTNPDSAEGGLFISARLAIPVLIALAVGVIMTFLATRTRFGRYVYAIGGNPEAAELAGINTKPSRCWCSR